MAGASAPNSSVIESAAIRVEARRDESEKLALLLRGSDAPIAPTHWSFGQLASLVGAPATYLRQLPAPLAGINLQYGLVRKHGGRQRGGWSFDLGHLHAKSGALSPLKHSAFDLRDIARRQSLTNYQLSIRHGPLGDERLVFAPIPLDTLKRASAASIRLSPLWTSCENARAIGDQILLLLGTEMVANALSRRPSRRS